MSPSSRPPPPFPQNASPAYPALLPVASVLLGVLHVRDPHTMYDNIAEKSLTVLSPGSAAPPLLGSPPSVPHPLPLPIVCVHPHLPQPGPGNPALPFPPPQSP